MKSKILMGLLFCSMHCMAQTPAVNGFIEFVPLFSNSVKHMPYDYMLKNNRAGFGNGSDIRITKDQPLEQSFYNIGFTTKLYVPMRNGCLLSFVFGSTFNEYNGSLSYQVYFPEDGSYSDVLTDTEEIIGYTAELKSGFSKVFYLDEKRKLIFLPELLSGLDAGGYFGELYDYQNRANVRYQIWEGNKMRIGTQLDLKLNYRITNAIGLGLTLEQVAQLFYRFSMQELGIETINKKNGFEGSVGHLTLPKISLICYFNEKK